MCPNPKPLADLLSSIQINPPKHQGQIKRLSSAIEEKQTYSIIEFERDSSEEFLFNAYWAILKRAPDSGSFVLLENLMNGILKPIHVLCLLRYSGEGSEIGVTIKKLPSRTWLLMQKFKGLPLVGFVVRMICQMKEKSKSNVLNQVS